MKDLFGSTVLEKRKNFSRNNLGQRRAGDFYQTPPSMTERFLDACPVQRLPVLEPAAGDGAMVGVLRARYGSCWVRSYDIRTGHDFLEERRQFPTVITNPPFSLSLEFIEQCKRVATDRFSLLMPIDYLHGIERYRRVFSARDEWTLSTLHVYVRRAMLDDKVREDGRYKTGMITWTWYTWRRRPWGRRPGNAPQVFWINNDEDVLRITE